MEQLQQQLQDMQAKMEDMQQQNDALKTTSNQLSNSLANVAAKKGGPSPQQPQPPQKMGTAGGGSDSPNAIVDSARNMMGVPTGAALPT
jgi:TolA-binding protein